MKVSTHEYKYSHLETLIWHIRKHRKKKMSLEEQSSVAMFFLFEAFVDFPSSSLQAPELAHARSDASCKAVDLLCQEGIVASWSAWDAPGCQGEFQQINLQSAMAHLNIPLQLQGLLNFMTRPLSLFLQPLKTPLKGCKTL